MGMAVGVETVLPGYTRSQRQVHTGNKKQLNRLQSDASACDNDSKVAALQAIVGAAAALIKAARRRN